MSRIVLAAVGTLGDFHPYLAMGIELRARGHHVRMATSVMYRETVERAGLEWRPLRPDLTVTVNASPEVVRRVLDERTGTEYVLKTLVLPYIEEMYRDLLDACRDADLLISHHVLFSAPLAVEKLGIKWIAAVLSPGIFLSTYDPPFIPLLSWFHPLRRLGTWPHSALHRWIDFMTRRWMLPVNELRAKEGLTPSSLNPVHAGMFSRDGTMGLFSQLLGDRQPDWPASAECTGFVFYDEQDRENREVETFLEAGPAPVVFTLGSAAVADPGRFYEISVEAARRIGCRAVFLTGKFAENLGSKSLPSTMLAAQYVSYSKLLHRASAVVHSGGIGTIAQCLRAGVPMVVVPFHADQPDNAYRAKRIGVARVIPRASYTAERCASELRAVLERADYRQAAARAAGIVQQEDGLARACDAVEKALQRQD